MVSLLIQELRSLTVKAPMWKDYSSSGFFQFMEDYKDYRSRGGHLRMAQLTIAGIRRVLCSVWNMSDLSLSQVTDDDFERRALLLWPSSCLEETRVRLCSVVMLGDLFSHLINYIHKFNFELSLTALNRLGNSRNVEIFIKNLRPQLLRRRVMLKAPETLQEAQQWATDLLKGVEGDLKIASLHGHPLGRPQPSKRAQTASSEPVPGPGRGQNCVKSCQNRRCGRSGMPARPSDSQGYQSGYEAYGSACPRGEDVWTSEACSHRSVRVIEVLSDDEDDPVMVSELGHSNDQIVGLRGKESAYEDKLLAKIASTDALFCSSSYFGAQELVDSEKLTSIRTSVFLVQEAKDRSDGDDLDRSEELPSGPVDLGLSTPLGAVKPKNDFVELVLCEPLTVGLPLEKSPDADIFLASELSNPTKIVNFCEDQELFSEIPLPEVRSGEGIIFEEQPVLQVASDCSVRMEVKDVDLGDAPVSILPLPAEPVTVPDLDLELILDFLSATFGSRLESRQILSSFQKDVPMSLESGLFLLGSWQTAHSPVIATNYFLADFFAKEQQFEATLRGNDLLEDRCAAG